MLVPTSLLEAACDTMAAGIIKVYDQLQLVTRTVSKLTWRCAKGMAVSRSLYFSIVSGQCGRLNDGWKYLQDCAHQASIPADFIHIEDMDEKEDGLNGSRWAVYIQERCVSLGVDVWWNSGPYLSHRQPVNPLDRAAFKAILSIKCCWFICTNYFPDSPCSQPPAYFGQDGGMTSQKSRCLAGKGQK